MEKVLNLIAQKLRTMIGSSDPGLIFSKRKAISTIFSISISLEQDGWQGMLDIALRAIWTSQQGFLWKKAKPYITTLFIRSTFLPQNRVTVLISPYVYWDHWPNYEATSTSSSRSQVHHPNGEDVNRWAGAVLAVPYTDEVATSVVDATLQIASSGHLRPYIPINVWALFKKKQPNLPPACEGRSVGTNPDIIHYIRELRDCEILKSYFLLVWSEWELPSHVSFDVMKVSIREDFRGTRMRQHREDLRKRLDYILKELGQEPEHFSRYIPQDNIESWIRKVKKGYTDLKVVLLEVERMRQ